MGFGGISIWSLLLILVIVLLLFGTKKLRNIGSDLGGAIRGFKRAMEEGEAEGRSTNKEVTPQIGRHDSAQMQQRDNETHKEHSS